MKNTLTTLLNDISSAVDYTYNQQKRNEMATLITSLPNFKSVENNPLPEESFLIFSDENGELLHGYAKNGKAYDFFDKPINQKIVYFYNGENK